MSKNNHIYTIFLLLESVRVPMLVAVLLSVTLGGCSGSEQESSPLDGLPFKVTLDPNTALLAVNSIQVEPNELLLIARIKKASIRQHFNASYRIEAGSEFWDEAFEGVSPRTELLHRTLVSCVEIRIRSEMALEFGIRGEASFENLVRRWQVENLRRKEMLDNGGEIFGPDQYSLEEFLENDLLSLDMALMQRLKEEGLLEEVDSIWDRQPGESRMERMRRLYGTYMKREVENAEVSVNEQAVYSIDLVGGELAL
jgi:hypothetical protein